MRCQGEENLKFLMTFFQLVHYLFPKWAITVLQRMLRRLVSLPFIGINAVTTLLLWKPLWVSVWCGPILVVPLLTRLLSVHNAQQIPTPMKPVVEGSRSANGLNQKFFASTVIIKPALGGVRVPCAPHEVYIVPITIISRLERTSFDSLMPSTTHNSTSEQRPRLMTARLQVRPHEHVDVVE